MGGVEGRSPRVPEVEYHPIRMARPIALAAVAWLALGSAMASAQSDDLERARGAFEQGRVAYEAGNFRTALERFQEAYRLTNEPDVLYNVATAADRLREDRVALEAYRGYLASRPDSADRAQVEARIEVLSTRLAREEEERARREAEEQALREQLARARPSDPGPTPWIVLGTGAALVAAGVVLVVVAEVDAACVREPAGCVQDPSAPTWAEVAGAYDRVPVLQGVGGALLGAGAVAAAIGIAWGLSGGGAAEVAVGPGGLIVRGRF